MQKFERAKHVFQSEAFAEIIKDTIRFFNGTPVHMLPPPEKFEGTGVYALYHVGHSPYYAPLYEQNRTSFSQPAYVGKAVPKGWRQGRYNGSSKALWSRLNEHFKSLVDAQNLAEQDFYCRFMILEEAASDMIGTVEAALIRHYTPIWNSTIDGFGNHTPGAGRFMQAPSDWDILHPGREWAFKCQGKGATIEEVIRKVNTHFSQRP